MTYFVPEDMTFTIANGQTTSSSIQVEGNTVLNVLCPATITGNKLTVQGSNDGTNFHNLLDPDNPTSDYQIDIVASKRSPVKPLAVVGYRFIRFVSNASPSEGGLRTFSAGVRAIQ